MKWHYYSDPFSYLKPTHHPRDLIFLQTILRTGRFLATICKWDFCPLLDFVKYNKYSPQTFNLDLKSILKMLLFLSITHNQKLKLCIWMLVNGLDFQHKLSPKILTFEEIHGYFLLNLLSQKYHLHIVVKLLPVRRIILKKLIPPGWWVGFR